MKRIFKMHKLDRYTGLDSTRTLFHVRDGSCIGGIVRILARMHDVWGKNLQIYGHRGEVLDKEQTISSAGIRKGSASSAPKSGTTKLSKRTATTLKSAEAQACKRRTQYEACR